MIGPRSTIASSNSDFLRACVWRKTIVDPMFEEPLKFAFQNNVGTTPRHISRNGHRTKLTRLRNNFGFTGILPSIQYFVGNTFTLKKGG